MQSHIKSDTILDIDCEFKQFCIDHGFKRIHYNMTTKLFSDIDKDIIIQKNSQNNDILLSLIHNDIQLCKKYINYLKSYEELRKKFLIVLHV